MFLSGFKFRFSSVSSTCFYKLLNVSTDSTPEQIKSAYFEMAKKYHPDSNPHTSVDPEKFRQIQQAYSTLSNPEKRKQYDKENSIISQAYYGDPTFGDNQKTYEQFTEINKESIYEKKEKEFTEYFEKQYFQNKDFFKKKVHTESSWNMSEKLFRQHQKIEEKKSEYVLLHPFQTTYYWEKKEDLKLTPKQTYLMLLFEMKYLILLIALGLGGFYAADFLKKQNEGKKEITKASKLTEGPGYKLKIAPLNIS